MPPDVASLQGGSLLVAWQLKDKHILIVGGGDVASGRIESVLVADARITLIAPRAGLHPLTQHLLDACPARITHHDRLFAGPADLDGVDNGAQNLLAAHEHGDHVIVASEPTTFRKEDWELIPKNTCVMVGKDMSVRREPVRVTF